MKRPAVACALACGLLSSACGGGSTQSTGSSSQPSATAPSAPSASSSAVPTQAEQGAAYTRITAPTRTAAAAFSAAINDQSTAAQTAEAAKPLIKAYQEALQALARYPWVGQTATDVRTLIAAEAQVLADLQAIGDQNGFSITSFAAQLKKEAITAQSAADIVRADVGLPPSGR